MRSAATWSINRVRGPGVRLDSPRHNSGPYRPEPQRAARPRSILERALGGRRRTPWLFALPSCLTPLRPHWQISGLKPSLRAAISWLNLVQPPCVCSPPFRAPKGDTAGHWQARHLTPCVFWLPLSLLVHDLRHASYGTDTGNTRPAVIGLDAHHAPARHATALAQILVLCAATQCQHCNPHARYALYGVGSQARFATDRARLHHPTRDCLGVHSDLPSARCAPAQTILTPGAFVRQLDRRKYISPSPPSSGRLTGGCSLSTSDVLTLTHSCYTPPYCCSSRYPHTSMTRRSSFEIGLAMSPTNTLLELLNTM